jgi:hypothetical protein
MPKKRITPPEMETATEAPTPMAATPKRVGKSRAAAAAPAKQAAPRKRSKAAAGQIQVQSAEVLQIRNEEPLHIQAKAQIAKSAQTPLAELLEPAVSEYEKVALLAYSFWEARGRQGGSPEDDWYRAEREILRRREPGSRPQ